MDIEEVPLPADDFRAGVAELRAYGQTVPDSWTGVRRDGSTLLAYFTDPDAHRDAVLARVPHPEAIKFRTAPYTRQHLDQVRDEIRALLKREQGSWYRTGSGTTAVSVSLRGGFDHLAAELHCRYGDAVELSVGAHPYPLVMPSELETPRPAPISTTSLPNARLDVVPDQVLARTPSTLHGIVRIMNTSEHDGLACRTGQPLIGYILDKHHVHTVGIFNGPVGGTGRRLTLEPGASTTIAFIAGTDTVDAHFGTALPPGGYGLVVSIPIHNSGTPSTQVITPATDIELAAS